MSSKILYKTQYLTLKQTKQGFIYAERRNIDSTASLCFRKTDGKYEFLIRYQPLPIVNDNKKHKWSDLFACPITGSMEENETQLDNAIREIYEEANYKVDKFNLISFNKTVATTQSNETVYNFVFDLSSIEKTNKLEGDGSIFENISKNKWISQKSLESVLFDNKKMFLSSLMNCYFLFLNYLNN